MTPTKPSLVARWRSSWVARYFSVGVVSVVFDFATLVVLVQFCHLAPLIASIIGVVAGWALGFVLNKYIAFRNHDPKVGRQVLRSILFSAAALAVYAALFRALTAYCHLHYLVAKIIADILIFGIGGFLSNRYLVFPKAKRGIGHASEPEAT